MYKIFALLILVHVSVSTYAKEPLTAKRFVETIQKNKEFNEECNYSNFDLVEADKMLSTNLNLLLKKIGTLKLSDFDMGECVTPDNIQENILTSYFWQKNMDYKGEQLSLYFSYNTSNQDLLVALTDKDLKSYLIGDKDNDLKVNIKKFSANLTRTEGVDIDSNLTYSDFLKTDGEAQYKYSKEIDAILYPKWSYSCKKDRFDNSKSCYLHNNDIGILLLNGSYLVSVGREHYPNSKASIKIDDNATITALNGMFNKTSSAIITQLKKGKIAYTRYYEWPYQYKTIDNESKLEGFSNTFNQMLEAYRKL
ncbi:MAG TPA: hypothetical protein DGS69_02350 [Acinetobacter baumannii]|nr:hypothetical protein [Acinetobacter baumannii]